MTIVDSQNANSWSVADGLPVDYEILLTEPLKKFLRRLFLPETLGRTRTHARTSGHGSEKVKARTYKTTIAMFKSMELQDLLEKAEDRLKRSFDDELEVGNQEGWESSNIIKV
jgi:hypothetical protein